MKNLQIEVLDVDSTLDKKLEDDQGFFRQVVQITVARLPTQILNDLRKFSKVLQIFPSILRLS